MRRGIVFQLEVTHREPMRVRGFVFGDERGRRACSIVASLRGDEVQQAFVCANLVARLERLEEASGVADGQQVLVIPCANPFSMNVRHRFWPTDEADINRSFPGDETGTTTERIAAAIMRVARTYELGIQLCSFNQAGDFLPHVRVTRQGPISDESATLAADFGLAYVLLRDPSPLDSGLLNYAWQEMGTHAFSLYSSSTDRIDLASADATASAVLRFLFCRGVLTRLPQELAAPHARTRTIVESTLIDVRAQRSAGFLVPTMGVGARVRAGQELARVLDAFTAQVLETLVAPTDGHVLFLRTDPLVQQRTVVARLAPLEDGA